MTQNETPTATIAPLTTTDLEAAAEGHHDDIDALREAVALAYREISEYAAEWAGQEVPEDHSEYGEPTVIWQDDDHVCIYVSERAYGHTVEALRDTHDVPDHVARSVPWAFNAFARRHGADADVLGTMDAVVLPRTETVDRIIAERA